MENEQLREDVDQNSDTTDDFGSGPLMAAPEDDEQQDDDAQDAGLDDDDA